MVCTINFAKNPRHGLTPQNIPWDNIILYTLHIEDETFQFFFHQQMKMKSTKNILH